jgi:NAD(P)-dependent dehydrogenase (short-subunit alcohol dehydrogenase family)
MGILQGKVAIVTGSSRGIGRSEAIALAKEGAAVVLAAYEDPTPAEKEIVALGGRALGVMCDVRKEADVKNVVQKAVEKFGTVDILVNNAHILVNPHEMENWTVEEMHTQFDSGPLGTWLFMRECFPYMKSKGGRIINTCSAAGHGFVFGMCGYGAAKEAIRTLTRYAAREWGKYGICVNAIAPAAKTSGAAGVMDKEMEQKILSTKALQRWGDAEADIGRVVVFLSGPDSSYITGDTLNVNGGHTMLV